MRGLREYVFGIILVLAIVALSVSMMAKPIDPPLLIDPVDAGSGVMPANYADNWCDVPKVVVQPRVRGPIEPRDIYEYDHRGVS